VTGRLIILERRGERRRDLAGALTRKGWQVREAEDIAQARAAIASEGPCPLVLACVPAEMQASVLVEALREPGRDVRIVVLGREDSAAEALRAVRSGAEEYLVPPISADDLSARLTALMTRPAPGTSTGFGALVAGSGAMMEAVALAERAARSRIAVLLSGESGTGKESFARAIHAASPRADAPFQAVNCGALPDALVESLLFGHEKGAFTGAERRHLGRFREAEGGTIFLDEVGELPALAQVKLLRVLQEGEVDPVGGSTPVKVDVRVVSATNRDLRAEIAAGRFREDLYFRLAGVEIVLPGLSGRPEDIPVLARRHAETVARLEGRRFDGFGPGVEAWLAVRPWPGNVRELQNVIHRAMVLSDGPVVPLSVFELQGQPEAASPAPDQRPQVERSRTVRPLTEVEAEAIADALMLCRGRISETARRLGIGRSTLYRKMREYGIAQDGARDAAASGG
jgi:DNA-binding NtrC family response regulator